MSDSSESGAFFFVDDHDIQSISYATQDKWFQAFLSQAFGGTVTDGIAGAKASLEFKGTAVGVVGLATTVQNVGPPAAQFSIDGNVIQTTTAPNNGSTDFSFVYFAQDGLDGSSSHTLEISVLNATEDYPFVMDYILYMPVQGATPTASQSIITTFLPAPTPAGDSASTSKSSVPVGAIVGGVIGGLALIVATAIAIWFLCFRRRQSTGRPYFYATSAKPGDLLDEENEVKPTPYEVPVAPSVAPNSTLGPGSHIQPGYTPSQPAPSAYSSSSAPSHYTPPSGLGYGSQSAYTPSEAPVSDYSAGSGFSAPSTLVLASGSTPRVTNSPNQPRSKAAEAGLLSVPQEATFHADSGVRFDANGQPIPAASASSSSAAANDLAPVADLSDVPPSYTPA